MISSSTLRILIYLRRNVVAGIETLGEAQEFIDVLEGVADEERTFLRLALSDRECLDFFYEKYARVPEGARRVDAARRRRAPAHA
jgi:hypothetical protein